MARVTVEDCVGVDKTNNRYELVMLAAQRANDIHSGAPVTVPVENDKKTVLALKEIASGNIKIPELRERFVRSLHPQSALNTLNDDLDSVDKDIIEEEFSATESEFALTEEQMLLDDSEGMFFEDINISEDDKY